MKLARCFAVSVLIFAVVPAAKADLKPEQVAVLVNRNSPESEEIGKYYLEKRRIPAQNLIELDLPTTDSMSREEYDERLVSPTRSALTERQLQGQVRVLVTTYGVPLRVLAPEASGDDKQALLEALSYQKQARNSLRDTRNQAELLLGREPPPDKPTDESGNSDEQLVKQTNEAIREYGESLSSITDAEKQKDSRKKLNLLLSKFGGLAAIVQTLKIPEGSGNEIAQGTLIKLKSDLQTAQRLLRALDEVPTPENRRRAVMLSTQTFGAIGVLGRANASVKMLQFKDADAAVDSELFLVWWNRKHYLQAERLPNVYYHRYSGPEHKIQTLLPVVFTSRLDGPNVPAVKKMIDQSILAETEGLTGKVYFDARGMASDTKSYGQYDQSLRNAAELLDKYTDFKVKLDNVDEHRYSQPGDAPEVALYAGWYKLRDYEDAFTFRPGAIGYHIASEEAVSLHDPEERGWCRNAIAHGISATLGSTGEPFVDTFPLPHEFFGLLLTGRYSLAEVYALTTPYMSWRMLLLGDPLYKPRFTGINLNAEDIASRDDTSKTLNPLPPAPTELPFPDPVEQRAALEKRLAATEKELSEFFKALAVKIKEQQNANAAQQKPQPKAPAAKQKGKTK